VKGEGGSGCRGGGPLAAGIFKKQEEEREILRNGNAQPRGKGNTRQQTKKKYLKKTESIRSASKATPKGGKGSDGHPS